MEIELVVTLVVVNILLAAVCLLPIWWKYVPKLMGKFRKRNPIKIGHMKLQDNQSWKLDLEDVDTRDAVLGKISTFDKTDSSSLRERVGIERIKKSGKTHIANYTKYRYTGSSSCDVEIYHQPTQQWVLYYLMFSTPFEDSSLKCNGVDVTGSCNSAGTSPVSRSDMSASPEYDDSMTRNNRYSDDYSSSSSNSGSSSSYSSSSD